jgi:hypothetical protein
MSDRDLIIRLSQTVTPFGVGSVYDVLGESFVACDTYRWGTQGRELKLRRLANALRVASFREAPRKPEGFQRVTQRLPFHRFPEWMFCGRCRRMTRLSIKYALSTPICRSCPGRPRLVPMRFVQICEAGHLGDVDWWWWAHSGSGAKRCEHRTENLSFRFRQGAGGGLASLEIVAACGAGRSLDGITGKDALKRVGARCTGGQPWQRVARGTCEVVPQVVQRGASNLHFPRLASAIDIPPDSTYRKKTTLVDAVQANTLFSKALDGVTVDGELNFIARNACAIIADDLAEMGATPEAVEAVVLTIWAERNDAPTAVAIDADLDLAEFHAFLVDQTEEGDFMTERTEIIDDADTGALATAFTELVEGVTLAHRLREVRALTGFTRLRPDADSVLSPSLNRPINWLPAIEVRGEGIFIHFSETALVPWESHGAVRRRIDATSREADALGWSWLPQVSARFIALHTLAHLLIRRLTFECGYSSASLREKVYARPPGGDEPMAGILIYTAAGDAEGSLGGLVRQGEPPRLARTLVAAAADASWCSADPICSEARSGPGGLNRGACHACSLVAETSCAHGNLLLDRILLTGGGPVPGLLAAVLDAAVQAVSQAADQ